MGRRKGEKKNKVLFDSDLFTCEVSPIYGRHLVAAVKIQQGQVLLKEKWMVAGPKANAGRVCIGCHTDLVRSNATVLRCGKCNWFICTPQCATNSPFHTTKECQFLTENNVQPPADIGSKAFGVIAVLRALLLKLWDPEEFKKLMLLQHHNEVRKLTPVWKEDEMLVKLIRETWKLGSLFTAQEIFAICGIFEVNGFEMGDVWNFGGIFFRASMLAHSCIPNATQSENIEEGCLEVTALVDIPPQTPITICYDAALKGTLERQKQLKKSKYFTCSCERCRDPTECGTHLSTLECPACKKGAVVPSQSESGDYNWLCSKCSNRMESTDIDNLVAAYKKVGNSLGEDIKGGEDFLSKCKAVFHANHYIPFQVKFNLCLAYGREDGCLLPEMTGSQIARKLELCTSVLKVLDVITPGYSVSRGNILYEIQAAQVANARLCVASGKCSRALMKKRLAKTLEILEEAIRIFEIHYPTRLLAQSARETTLKELKEWMTSL